MLLSAGCIGVPENGDFPLLAQHPSLSEVLGERTYQRGENGAPASVRHSTAICAESLADLFNRMRHRLAGQVQHGLAGPGHAGPGHAGPLIRAQ